MKKFVAVLLLLVSLSPAMAGSYTPNNWLYLPSYGAYGPSDYTKFNNAATALDAAFQSLYVQVPALAALLNNWAIEDQIVTMIPLAAAPTYSDGDTFTLTGDYTSRFPTGAVVQIHLEVPQSGIAPRLVILELGKLQRICHKVLLRME